MIELELTIRLSRKSYSQILHFFLGRLGVFPRPDVAVTCWLNEKKLVLDCHRSNPTSTTYNLCDFRDNGDDINIKET